jgi:hypothetical protein
MEFERVWVMKEIEEALASVLARHQDAMDASDMHAGMSLYAEDGVLMPRHS